MFRILFVSHDAGLRAVVSRVLSKEGWDVTAAAHSGHASLACLETAFDVLIVEDQMPETTGGALAARLRRYGPDFGVIRLCEPGAMTAGEGLALVRPFTADDLVDALVALTVAAALPAGAGR